MENSFYFNDAEESGWDVKAREEREVHCAWDIKDDIAGCQDYNGETLGYFRAQNESDYQLIKK